VVFRIKEAREKAGYSQKELAEIIGVAPNTFHGYESGKHDPKSVLLAKIAAACNVSVDFLLGQKEKPTTETGSGLSSEEEKVLEAFRLVPKEQQPLVRGMIEGAAKSSGLLD
jgi:Predicted transcriptional regulators